MLLAVLTLPDWFAGERPDKATPRSPRLGVGGCYYSIAKKTEVPEFTTAGEGRDAGQATRCMRDMDESQSNISSPIANLLTPKETIYVGCWNVRTLYQAGKLAQTIERCTTTDYAYWESRKHAGQDPKNDCWPRETPSFG